MGCVSSKRDINDTHPNIFEVMNVDEAGHYVSPGQLELSETELILYQRGKSATVWPLRSLRKYGFDSEIFSFECGRRCPTGPGIYAFRCRKAEDLFNMLQHNIQSRNISEEGTAPAAAMYMNFGNPVVNSNVNSEFPIPLVSTGPPVNRRIPSQTQPEGYLNPTMAPVSMRPHPSLSRPGSLSSNGPASPVTPPVTSPPPDLLLEHNNNKQNNLVSFTEHSYTNTNTLTDNDNATLPPYINLSSVTTCNTVIPSENYTNFLADSSCHLYMNVDTSEAIQLSVIPPSNLSVTKEMPNILPIGTDVQDSLDTIPKESDLDETKHCYANINSADLEDLRASFNPNLDLSFTGGTIPETSTYVMVREVNYAELDLVPSKSDHSSLQVTPDSPSKPNKSYVTIDFKKTNALSQTVNPSIDVEEGSRKTRHNSTISDKTTRHSNSLSD
ncbi:hypothetical protein PPYR_11375 [Photinus pyralis]|uniref:IRS-type PTB domain-containing protein n=1 Tax=Photinus pyralis TaxID=7054 RepID=A0A1Y1MLR0_PHOPY|nr:fibroblast growth factor receptor substrate 2 [Photinus pyralis]KAB0794536.1 hypothetical protein PPYR_11375 [Photinus pyralis]